MRMRDKKDHFKKAGEAVAFSLKYDRFNNVRITGFLGNLQLSALVHSEGQIQVTQRKLAAKLAKLAKTDALSVG